MAAASCKDIRRLINRTLVFAGNCTARRYCSSLTRLRSRSLLRITGEDKESFLQGLCTADVLSHVTAQYAMFLNAKGRVLSECILYRPLLDQGAWLLECCQQGRPALERHLNMYRLRAKVRIEPCEDYAVCWSGDARASVASVGAIAVPDPRTSELGSRVLLPLRDTSSEEETSRQETSRQETSACYDQVRWRVGVAEGSGEVPPGECTPLEYNLDLLSGVSFSKGCYLGQELTARAHFTGVVRKRVVPMTYRLEDGGHALPRGAKVVTKEESGEKKSVGRVVAQEGRLGLGLIKFKTRGAIFVVDPRNGSEVEATFTVPAWWREGAE